MDPTELIREFNKAILDGYDTRQKRANGLVGWQTYKAQFEKTVIAGFETGIPVKQAILDLFRQVYQADIDDKDHAKAKMIIGSVEMTNTIESNHFFIQHARIPLMAGNKISVLKLLQIAYNAGQFAAERESENVYDATILEFYDSSKLAQLATYVVL